MPLSSDGRERTRVAPKEKRKSSRLLNLQLVWAKKVCIIQSISPGEDWWHRDLWPEAQLAMCSWRWFQLQESIAVGRNGLKLSRFGALAKPFVTSRDQLSFLLPLLSISYFYYFSLSFQSCFAISSSQLCWHFKETLFPIRQVDVSWSLHILRRLDYWSPQRISLSNVLMTTILACGPSH